jgi:hypothetical protein
MEQYHADIFEAQAFEFFMAQDDAVELIVGT